MDFRTAHKQALMATLCQLPLEHPVFRGGRTVRAFRSKMQGEFEFTETGDRSGYSFSLRFLRDELQGDLPKPGELCEMGGKRYRVLTPVELDAYEVSVVLHLAGESAHVNR